MLIKDLEFNPTFTDTQYDKCIEFFEEGPEIVIDYCTKYIIVGDTVLINAPAACHAALGSHTVKNVTLVATEIALVRRNLQNCDGAMEFLDWMLNHSFASRFIVNKPEHRTLEWVSKNGIIVSADVMQPLFQMIMIFSRSHSERSSTQFAKWKELVDDGFDPHFAYQVCMCVMAGGGLQTFPDEGTVTTRTGHTTTYLLTLNSMKMFCEGELGSYKYETRAYKVNKSIYGCFDLFQEQTKKTHKDNFVKDLFNQCPDFRLRMKAFRNEDTAVEAYRPPNPFKRPSMVYEKNPDDVTYQEYFNVVIPYMKEKGLFYNAPNN